MELRLERQPSADGCTLGAIYLWDHRLCYTLEDVVRDHKLEHETAIPFGRYPVGIDWSRRFNRLLPFIDQVPGFTGVRIHGGNTAADTAGCILVGVIQTAKSVQQCQPALQDVMSRIASVIAPGGDVWLSIVQAPDRTLTA